ncbi:MAG: PAS domain S-box protein, partial [Nitrospina sp.]|nr:PAS domain S-box protein [Nitrospina sp.]
MEIKLRDRLSYRQAKTAVLAGLAIGIVLSAIQIGYDYAQELREIDTEVSDVINMFRESATQASYTVDETLAETVVKGLLEFQPIFDAKVIDEFGEVLGHKKRPVEGGKLEWLVGMMFGREKSYKVALLSTEGQKNLGQIELLVDNYLVARDFIRRAGFVIMGGLLRNICLAFIFVLIFYYTLTKPLLATVKGVLSVDPSRPSRKLLDFPKGHNKDEIGLLVRMINRLLEGFDKSLAGRQAAEEELKKQHDRLEELVKERTAELVKANDELKKEIDERMQTQEKLREEKDFTESLIDTAQVIILLLDTKGRIVRFNAYMEDLSGYKIEEVQGRDWFSTFLPGQDHNRVRELFRTAINKIQTRGNINSIVAKDGREIVVEWFDKTLKDADGNTVGLLAIGQDITERKQAEEALRESEERYLALFDRSLEMVYLCDFQGNFIDANDAALELMGYTKKDIKSLNFSSLLAEGQLPLALETVEEILKTGSQKGVVEYKLKRKDGGHFFVESTGALIYRDGKPYAIQGIARDITERKRAEEVLRESEEKLARSRKMEAMGLMAGGVAHDLNNILSGIVSYPELLLVDLPEDSPLRNPIKTIQESGMRAAD